MDLMKSLNFAGVLAGMAIVCAITAFAADKGSMKVYDPLTVNGTQLSPGDYGLQWEGTGNNVQLKILRGKQVLTTTPATLEQLQKPARSNMVATRNDGDHGKVLTGIMFYGKKYALEIGSASSQADVAKK